MFQLFNLETMSGVFPGTRTMVFQRLRLQSQEQGDQPPGNAQWVRCCGMRSRPRGLELGANLLRIPEPRSGNFSGRLAEALAAYGLRYMACGSCAFWQLAATKTADGLPTGRCTWKTGGAGEDACAPEDASLRVWGGWRCSRCWRWTAVIGNRLEQRGQYNRRQYNCRQDRRRLNEHP